MKTLLSAVVGATLALGAGEAGADQTPGERQVALEIRSKTLLDALDEWAKQTGIQIFVPDWRAAQKLPARNLRGTYSVQGALDELLAGTTFTYMWLSDRAVSIREKVSISPAVLQTENHAGKQSASGVSKLASEDPRTYATAGGDSTLSTNRGAAGAVRGDVSRGVANLEEIVVTGTHIHGAVPAGSALSVFDRSDIDRSGSSTVEQFLRTIPQNLSSIDANTSQVNAGGRDINSNAWFGATVNLHGLGSGATLVLLNGQRLAPAGGQGEFVDVSMIPLSAVERIEVLSDGASAIYGSDAVAGVVNFILRNDYHGAETTVRFADSSEGGAAEMTASQLLGTGWSTGNAMLVYEYQDQDALLARQRDFVPVSGSDEAGTFRPSGTFTLLPQRRRNGMLVSASQDLGDTTSLRAHGFWSKRDFEQSSLTGGVTFGETYISGSAEQLGSSVAVAHELPGRWNAELVANWSRLEQDLVQRDVALDQVRPFNFVTNLSSLDARADGPVFDLPAGTVHASVGVGGRREGVDVAATTFVPQFDLHRDVVSAYGEVLVPILGDGNSRDAGALALSAAARYDRYDDFGSATQPRVGLAWIPLQGVTLRGTYSRSYKAPTLIQRHETNKVYQLISIPDAGDSDGYVETMLISGVGNANLEAERARSYSFGIDFTPQSLPGLSLSGTYFDVDFKNRISGPPLVGTTFDIYNEPAVASFISRDVDRAEIDRILSEEFFENFSGPDFTGTVDPHLTEAFYDDRPRNVASTKESGVDFSATYGFDTARGAVELMLAGTKLFEIDYVVTPTTPAAELLNKTFRPMDLRLRAGVSWTMGKLAASASMSYAGSYENNLVTPRGRVDSWLTTDLQLKYSTGATAPSALFRDTTLVLTVVNVTDEDPPAVPYGGLFTNFNYDSANASPLGRFISLQLGRRW